MCDSVSVIRFKRYDLSSCCLSPRIAALWEEPGDIEGQCEHSTRCAVVVGGGKARGDGMRREAGKRTEDGGGGRKESFDRRTNTSWYVREHFNLTENDARAFSRKVPSLLPFFSKA